MRSLTQLAQETSAVLGMIFDRGTVLEDLQVEKNEAKRVRLDGLDRIRLVRCDDDVAIEGLQDLSEVFGCRFVVLDEQCHVSAHVLSR
jgi:hypothetical protein